jgi:hypothetical protein
MTSRSVGSRFKRRIARPAIGTAVVISALPLFFTACSHQMSTVPSKGTAGMSIGERQSLDARGAFTTHPIRFLLVGDSIALTLGTGLSEKSVSRYGVAVVDKGTLGCDLDSVEVRLSGGVGPATPGCLQWRTQWKQYLAQVHPDVVGLLIGRWDVSDHLYHGAWVHVGEATWDEHLTSELVQAFDLLASQGARVVAFTMPYLDPPNKAANGTPFPENTSARAAVFNNLLVRAAGQARDRVTVIDLNKLLDPSGHFQPEVDGLQVRWSDGIHITTKGGAWLQPSILPVVAREGLQARAGQ